MGAVIDLAFSLHDFANSNMGQVVTGAISALLAGAATTAAAAATRQALRRAQRRNEIEILRVRRAIAGDRSPEIRAYDEEVEEEEEADEDERVSGFEIIDYLARVQEARPLHRLAQAPVEERILASMERRSEARFQIQSEHWASALRQSTSYFYLSMFVGILGFILIVTGVGLAFGGLAQVGTVTGVAGLLTDGAAGLIFNQANKAKSDAQSNLAAIALAQERDENRQMALIYSSRITDPQLRDSTNVELARKSLDAVHPKQELPAPPPGSADLTP